MPTKPTVLVHTKVGKGKTIDQQLSKGTDRAMLAAAIKAFRQHAAVKATRDKTGYEYTAVLKSITVDAGTLSCEIEGLAHPLGKMKPMLRASNGGKMQGATPRDAADLVAAVVEGQVKKIEGQLKKLK